MNPLNTTPPRLAQRSDAQLDLDLGSVAPQRLDLQALSQHRAFAAAQIACEPVLVTRTMPRRHDQLAQNLPDRLIARPAEDRLRLRVPVHDDAALVHLNEAVQGRDDDTARHALAVEERRGLVAHLVGHAGEGLREPADLAARIGRDRGRLVAREALDRPGHLDQRPGQGAGEHHRQRDRAEDGQQPGEQAGIAHRDGGGHEARIRDRLDDRDPRALGQPHRAPADAELGAGAIPQHPWGGGVGIWNRRDVGKIVLHPKRHSDLEAELPRRVRMDQIVSPAIDQEHLQAVVGGRTDTGKCRPQIEGDDHHPERRAVRLLQRCREVQDRHMRLFDDAVLAAQPDRRYIDLAGGQLDRLLQGHLGLSLQRRLRNRPDGAVRAGAIDPHDVAPAVVEADDAKRPVARLGGELRRVARSHAGAPHGLGGPVDRIDAAGEPGADDAGGRHRRAEAHHIGARDPEYGFELVREHAGAAVDTFEIALQRNGFDVAIGEVADGRGGEQHQPHHRQCQTRRQSHAVILWLRPMARCGRQNEPRDAPHPESASPAL